MNNSNLSKYFRTISSDQFSQMEKYFLTEDDINFMMTQLTKLQKKYTDCHFIFRGFMENAEKFIFDAGNIKKGNFGLSLDYYVLQRDKKIFEISTIYTFNRSESSQLLRRSEEENPELFSKYSQKEILRVSKFKFCNFYTIYKSTDDYFSVRLIPQLEVIKHSFFLPDKDTWTIPGVEDDDERSGLLFSCDDIVGLMKLIEVNFNDINLAMNCNYVIHSES